MVSNLPLAFIVASLVSSAVAARVSPIEHVIVLMFENRAFDHMLGHLSLTNPDIDGLNPGVPRCNPVNPLSPPNSTEQVCVNWDVVDFGPDDPCHSFDCITQQTFGFDKHINDTTSQPLMNGFVANTEHEKGNISFVFSAHNASNLPVLSALATEFALFDHWHVSVPSCTNPNREMMMSGTSWGYLNNSFPKDGFPQKTHFSFLEEHNVNWTSYYSDAPWLPPAFADLRNPQSLANVIEMSNFYASLTAGNLSQFNLIEPRMSTSNITGLLANSQHPDNSVSAGEQLLADVYNALRASSYWEKSLLIVTYDEHGGFYDHQPNPQQVGIPSPDGIFASNGFDFTRLGVRVPTVAVSPWIAKGTVVHKPSGSQAPSPTSEFEATSTIATTNAIFGITDHLTARDAWSGRFDNLLSGAFTNGAPRKDCPLSMPTALSVSAEQTTREMTRLLNDHHLETLNLFCSLEASKAIHPVCKGFESTSVTNAAESTRLLEELLERAMKAVLINSEVVGDTGSSLNTIAKVHTHEASAWASAFPDLVMSIATKLQQQDFEPIVRALFAQYKLQLAK